MKRRVLIGFLGSKLDRVDHGNRWQKWRPTVALFQHDDLAWDHFVLLSRKKYDALAQEVLADVRQVSPETQVEIQHLEFKNPWDFQEVYETLLDWAKGFEFKPEEEEYYFHLTTGTHVAQICGFLLTEAHYFPGRLIQSSPNAQGRSRDGSLAGAYEIIDLDLSRYDRLATRFEKEVRETQDFLKMGIATKNPKFNALIEQMEVVVQRSKEPVLLMGPTGAGKSVLASRIYELRKQRCGLKGNFVEVNCATLRGDQAMSTLFGHKRGSFTGALQDRAGLLREAHLGMIFLDEIGELGLDEQAMLLRALEDHSFMPLGSDKMVKSEFQLIAGTHRDLREEVAQGRFREDLLARIHLWTFELPGLADRREDLEVNLDYELDRYELRHRRKVTFNKEARTAFLKFAKDPSTPWSANFRDLNAAVTRMATLSKNGRIRVEEVEQEKLRLLASWKRKGRSALSDLQMDSEPMDAFDEVQLAHVVEVCRTSSSLSEAGRKLYSVSRQQKSQPNDADRLKKYLARFGLDWARVKSV